MKRVRGRIVKIEKDSAKNITRVILNYAGRVRYATFRGEPPKCLNVNESYRITVDDARLKLIECILLDKYGNLLKRVFP
ncbi:MAG: hypothetical protein RMJ31_04870 [Nitrososphaerota archaeon]|nr:hypothetical protein [Nitrososphaerales archaeon]MDW8045088.1 hypothetical protein [Nitrososphaerota archaeon]